MFKRLLALSVGLNLIFLSLFSYLIYKRGGLQYLAGKLKTVRSLEARESLKKKGTLPSGKESLFEVLPHTKGDNIFLGDSMTSDCEWSELFKCLRVKNRGIGGDTTASILSRLDQIVETQPSKIFLMVGTNDFQKRVALSTIVENYRTIIEMITKKSPETELYIQSVLPVNNDIRNTRRNNEDIAELNKELKLLASEFNLTYVDLFSLLSTSDSQLDPKYSPDGLHLNGKGYLVWKSAIEKYVNPPPLSGPPQKAGT